MKRNQKAFTLVELLACVTIIGVLAAVGMPAWLNSMRRSEATTCSNNLRIWLAARDAYYLDHPEGPAAGTNAAQFKSMLGTYLPAGPQPGCPCGGEHTIAPARGVLPACSLNGTKREALNDFPQPYEANGFHDIAK